MRVKNLVLFLGLMFSCSGYSYVEGRAVNLDQVLERLRKIEYDQVQDFVSKHQLYFIYAGVCPHCHKASPAVKRFAERFNFDVIAVSFDGGALDEFPDFSKDKKYIKQFRIMKLPALVVVNKATGLVVDLQYGIKSEASLINDFANVLNAHEFNLTKTEK